MDNIAVDVLSSLNISELPHWVVWREEKRGHKLTKVPYTPHTENRAESDKPDTWRTFDQAVDAYQNDGKWDGIGFNFSYSGITGIDLDGCIDSVTGTIAPWASEVIEQLDSYTEVSVSGLGVHILVEGELPVTGKVKIDKETKKPYIEAYMAGRYFTMTGNVLQGHGQINSRQESLTTFYLQTFQNEDTSLSQQQPASESREIGADDIASAAKWLEQLHTERCEAYDTWLKVGMALSELGEIGLALWDRWSQQSPKYEPGACRKKWGTIVPGEGITLSSLRHWAEEDAAKPDDAARAVAFRVANRVFTVRHDCLYVHSKAGERQISTFMFYPKRLLVDADQAGEDALLGDIASSGMRWPDMILPKSAFSTAASLCKALPSIYWQWMGNDNDTKTFLMYISDLLEKDGMPSAQSTTVIGRHGKYWVTKELTMDAEHIYLRSEAPILYRSPEIFARNKLSDTAPNIVISTEEYDQSDLIVEIAENLAKCNQPDAVALMVGWFCACPLKAVFLEAGIRFPHLNIFGTKGSGKTTSVLRLFLPLLGVPNPATWTPNTTMFVIRSLFSSTNAVPISVGEFRSATLQSTRSDFLRILLMAYDSGRDARGQADLSTKTFDLLAPVVVDGEDALSDPAIRERTIFVNLHPEDITDGSPAFLAMDNLMRLPLSDFAAGYLRHTLTIDAKRIAQLFYHYLDLTKECPLHLPHRMRHNMAVVMCGQHIYNEYVSKFGALQLAITVSSFEAMIKSQGILLADGRSRSSVDDFVEKMVSYASSGSEYHFSFLLRYDAMSNVLWFHLPSAHSWWRSNLKREGVDSLEFTALRAQLIERAADGYAIRETQIQTTTHGRISCFGVSLNRCVEYGLNVPEKLDVNEVEIRGGV